MNVNMELLYNQEKGTYSIINLDNGEATSLQHNAGIGISNVFTNIQKTFPNAKERTSYINKIQKEKRIKNEK